MSLERELATYRANLAALLAKDAGRFVLIHADDIVGVWDTNDQALEEGYERIGLEPFLVKHIIANEQPIFVPWENA